ncbi:hypothetical protein RO3G_15440 [Rhizopus delemar RA 99-880]|uniref:Uncharacterized protein n=1 Tax=Rhizopus delemar (strain RA 99-880 / ATCC MYA-4621 / FGSC 9543 / NRRL 43880) TaxID=246409 RepID=I1CQJ9_RHIO9|nr:hypothetical protein RO3G_15440 [Rhizopus delemar RA 99-880]|eukprot:EIE90729.1 hypothetical protein RO3G_15440 [Rhizopus delemar RA 99-880]
MLVHLRSTNSLPNEKRETRPDAAISEKPHLEFTSSIGFGEAKVKQRSSARYSLCIDNLRLTTFCKNTIDDNKLDGAIAFQIHVWKTCLPFAPGECQEATGYQQCLWALLPGIRPA